MESDVTYKAYVRYNDDSTIGAWGNSANFTTDATCAPPTGLVIEELTTTKALISWTPGQANQTTWYTWFDLDDMDDVEVSEPHRLLTGLTPNTEYDFRVTGNCEDGDGLSSSIRITFTTPDNPSLVVNEGTTTRNNVVVNTNETSRNYGSTQFIIPADEITDLQYSTIEKIQFHCTNETEPWGYNARFKVYLCETSITSNYICGDEFFWDNAIGDNMTLFYEGQLYIEDGVMTIEPNGWVSGFEYQHLNLFVGIEQVQAGTNGHVNWYGVPTDDNVSAYINSQTDPDVAECTSFVPQVTFYYQTETFAPPANFYAYATGIQQASCFWTMRAGQTYTEVEVSTNAEFNGWGISDLSTDTYCHFNNAALEPQSTYFARSRAIYEVDGQTHYSVWGPAVSFTMPEDCGIPTNLQATNVEAYSATLTWEANGEYEEVEMREGATGEWVTLGMTENGQFDVNNLGFNTTYGFRVRTFCASGFNSEWSDEAVFTTKKNIDFADENVKAICVSNSTGWDQDHDGELSYVEAANVTDISSIFTFNEEITSFKELQYFTGLTEINANAFEDCTNLASVTLPESIISIENWAFSGCESLTGILIPEGVTNIIVGAFYYSGLESIVIPASVTQIGSEAFSYCTNLQSITVANDNPNYTSNNGCNVIVEKATNKLIAGCAYSYIYEGVETIAKSAFIYTGITTLELPSTLQTIGEQAFSGCESLVSIDLPAGLTNIEKYAFSDCTNLAEITCHATTPPTLGTDPFINVDKTIPVYVPCGSLADYQNATGWSDFTNMTESQCVFNFVNGGNWSEEYIWDKGALPSADDAAVIHGNCTLDMDAEVASLTINDYVTLYIESGQTLTVTGDINIGPSGYLYIFDGGQLIHSVNGVMATVEMIPVAYTDANVSDGWNLIASPISGTIETSSVQNLLDHEYDLYYYDEPAHYWRNEKNPDNYFNTLRAGQGYLFAINIDDQLGFTGPLNSGTSQFTEYLSYTEEVGKLKGFNLVGNPFVHNVTTFDGQYVAEDVYRLNGNRDDLVVSDISNENPLKPCEGFFVKATQEDAYITFNNSGAKGSERSMSQTRGRIIMEISQNNLLIDRFIVKDGGEPLEKFTLKDNGTKIFAERDNEEMAVVPAEGNEQAVSFKAPKNGTYTLRVSCTGMNLSYLHLIDNMTGTDIDLLQTNEYIFSGKPEDYASRFRLVFDANGNANADNTFAYVDAGGNIVIANADAHATLQVIDVMGRVVVSTDVARGVSTNGMTAGVYVLRLIDGDDVKVQKIVIQ